MKHVLVGLAMMLGFSSVAATLTAAPVVDSIADLTNRVVSSATSSTTLYVEVTQFAPGYPKWEKSRKARFSPGDTRPVVHGAVEPTTLSNARWVFDDCFSGDPVNVTWFGAKSDPSFSFVSGPTIQAAIDFVNSRTNSAGRRVGGTVKVPAGLYTFTNSIIWRPRVNIVGEKTHYSDINFVTSTVTNTSYAAGGSVQFFLAGGANVPFVVQDPTDSELYARQSGEPQEDGSVVDSMQYSQMMEGIAFYTAAQTKYDCHTFKLQNAWGVQLRDVYVWTRFGYAVWAKDLNALKIINCHLVGGSYSEGGRGVLFWGTGDSKIVDSEIGGMIGPGVWVTGSSAGKDTVIGNQIFNQQRHRQMVSGYDTNTDTITLDSNHLLETGMLAEWTKVSGASPSTNVNLHQPYWVIKVSTNSLKLATTESNALAGVAIDLTGSIAGTNYVWSGPGASLYGSWAAENMVVTGNRFEQNQETGIYLSDSPGWEIVGNMTYYNQYDNANGVKDPISVPNIYLRGINTGTIIQGNSLDADSVRYGPDYGIQVEDSSAAFVSSRVLLGPNGIRKSVVQDYLIGTNNFHAIITRYTTNESTGFSGLFVSRLETIGAKLGNTNSGADVTIPLELQTPASGVPIITARRLSFPKLGIRVTGSGMGPGNQNGFLFMNEEEGYFGANLVFSTNTSTLRLGGTGAFQTYTRDAELAGDIGGATDLPSRRMYFNPPIGTGSGSSNSSGFMFRLPSGGASGTTAHSLYDALVIGPDGAALGVNDTIFSIWDYGSGSRSRVKISSGSEKALYTGTEPTFGGGSGGETNTASNLGTPSSTVQGLYSAKSGADLRFRSIEAGANITLTSNANTITITASGSGGGTTNGLGVNGSFRTDWNLTNSSTIQYSIASTTNVSSRLADRDWGDVTTTSSGSTITIDNDAVTYAKIQNVSAASRLLGRGSASGSGDAEEITLGSGLTMTGTTLSSSGSGTAISTNGGNTAGLPVVIHPDFTFGTTNTLSVATQYIGTIILTNAVGVDSGGTGDTNLTANAILAGNGTSPIKEVGPVAHGLAGWSNSVAAVITAGSNVTITNGVISATGGSGSGETNTASNLGTQSGTVQGLYNSKSGADIRFRSIEAGSGITLTSNANTLAISATGGGSSTFTTNLLGYIARSVTQVSVSNTTDESVLLNFDLPANTLNVDGDELEVYVPSKYQMYNSQTTTYRWDFYLDYNETPSGVAGDYTSADFPYTSSYYSQLWIARIKRMSSNTVSMMVTHILGSDSIAKATNLVEQTQFLQNYTMQNPGGWSSNFNFALTVTLGSANTVHGVNTFGYTIHKIGSGGSGGSGAVNLNDLGDVDAATPSTNAFLVFDGAAWTKTNSPTIDGTVVVRGTNSATLDMGDAQSTPKFATLAAPSVIQTNYQIVLPSNAIPGVVVLSSLTSTTLVATPVASSGTSGHALLVTNTGNGYFFGSIPVGGSGGDVYTASNNVFTGSNTFSGAVTLGSSAAATTPSALDSDTSVATTAWVRNEIGAISGRRPFNLMNGDMWSDGWNTLGAASITFTPFNGAALASGTSASTAGTPDHPSYATISSSGSANSGYGYGGGNFYFEGTEIATAILYCVTTNTLVVKSGFLTTPTSSTESANGAYIRFENGYAFGRTALNDVLTTTITSNQLSAATWYTVETEINSNATAATFRLYNDSGTLVWSDSITTSLPTASNRLTSFGTVAYQATGGTTAILWLDALGVQFNRKLTRYP